MLSQRSEGVPASAVISLLGSALCLLFATLIFLSGFYSRSFTTAPSAARVALFLECTLFGALAAWGIITAGRLFQLRSGACASIRIIGFLLALSYGSGALYLAFFRTAPQPEARPAIMTFARIVLACFCVCLAGLGGWWLYLLGSAAFLPPGFRNSGLAGRRSAVAETAAPRRGNRGLRPRPIAEHHARSACGL